MSPEAKVQQTATRDNEARSGSAAGVERAKEFYRKLGWRLDGPVHAERLLVLDPIRRAPHPGCAGFRKRVPDCFRHSGGAGRIVTEHLGRGCRSENADTIPIEGR
jgi:hypothetical protein